MFVEAWEMYESTCPPSGPEPVVCLESNSSRRSRRNSRRAAGHSHVERMEARRRWGLFLSLSWLVWAFTGCGGTAITGSATGGLQISPGSLSFGSVSVGKSATASVLLVNLNSSPIEISAIKVSGDAFSVSAKNSLPLTLAGAGGTYTLSVTFNPSTSGAATGQLSITSNVGPDLDPVVGLSGMGLMEAPAVNSLTCSIGTIPDTGTDSCAVTLSTAAPSGGITVNLSSSSSAVSVPASVIVAAGATSAGFVATASSVSKPQGVVLTASEGGVSESTNVEVEVADPALTVSAASLAFGNVSVNTAATQTVTVTSTGAAAVTINSASITGTGFTVSTPTLPVTLSPGNSATLTVKFDPAVAGAETGQLTIVGDASSGNSLVNLTATGVPVLTGVSCTGGTITGSGTDACSVTLNSAAATGGFAVGLASNNTAVSVPSSVTVAAGSATGSFTATGSSVSSAQSATLTATAGSVNKTFALTLNPGTPTLALSATSLSFGSVSIGTAATQTLTLTSTGSAPVTVTSATVTGSGFTISGITLPLTLSSSSPTAKLTVQFDPSSSGAVSGQIALSSNSSSGATTSVGLSGTGVPALSAISCTNASMSGSGTDACTVTLKTAAPSSGLSVALSSNNSAVHVPASVTVASGSTTGAFSATVSSVSTAQAVTLTATAGTISKTFALQLIANVATLTLNGNSVSFGDVTLNSPSTQTVTLTSSGAAPVTVSQVTISGAGFSFSGVSFPLTLNSSSPTANISVEFDPTVTGAATGQLTITSNSSTGATSTVSLSGTGVTGTVYKVDVTWNAPASSPDPVAGYNIYRSPGGSSSYVLMGSVKSNVLSFLDSNNIQDGAAYDYIVESVDASGNESNPSNTASVSIPD
jgi:hypothetical protein